MDLDESAGIIEKKGFCVEAPIRVTVPFSTSFNNFTRVSYDNKLKNKLYYSIDSRKLILEAIQAYEHNPAHNLEEYLTTFKDKRMREIVLNSECLSLVLRKLLLLSRLLMKHLF